MPGKDYIKLYLLAVPLKTCFLALALVNRSQQLIKISGVNIVIICTYLHSVCVNLRRIGSLGSLVSFGNARKCSKRKLQIDVKLKVKYASKAF